MTISVVQVDTDDVARVEVVEMDPGDRHVLAAALSAGADILLTNNTRHFPRQWMANHGIELLTAGSLLIRLVDQFPDQLRAAHAMTVRSSLKPEADIIGTLARAAGPDAAEAIRQLTQG